MTPTDLAPQINPPTRLYPRRRTISWSAWIGFAGILLITLIALLAPWLTPYDPYLRVTDAYLPPSQSHVFGTDGVGRDLLSRILVGVQSTWLASAAVIAFSLLFGTLIGALSGAIGGKTDFLVQRVVDLFLVFPGTLIAFAMAAVLGPGLLNSIATLAIFWWPWYARISRDEIRRLRTRPHFEAARAAGVGRRRLLLVHLLPGALPSLIIAATLDVSNMIMALSVMSFLGLGQPAPSAELGAMTARSLDSLTVFWWIPILPASALLLMCLFSNLAGDGLRSALKGT
ncbi:ABC transporter permease [Ensifer sp. ENS12]|uniref:ABC transporter permease n=1 Tax=Ensifer sp. ENS12 TaxID=2854774 RepID=UPI001C43A30B|nr:ABC transporter permease [Ensifer sp. ENS12]MBV7518851.1 ABC transporter permease [Ensifer sp. ENS12]